MKERIIEILAQEGIKLEKEKRVNDAGDQLKFSNGSIVNCFDNGTINYQGRNTEETKGIIGRGLSEGHEPNRKVFVVYGHDKKSRVELEAMLRRWDLEPLILDQLPSGGQTIIEKLEEFTPQVRFGIVLATPDDVGYAKGQEDKIKCRVRQNVILEMGMLLASLGRSRIAILLNTSEELESPSDIDGLIYIPFKDNIEETKLSLAKEMQKHKYKLDISKL